VQKLVDSGSHDEVKMSAKGREPGHGDIDLLCPDSAQRRRRVCGAERWLARVD
jgi:hypothetical protein